MKIKEIIGIDVSKLFLDVCLHLSKNSAKFENTPKLDIAYHMESGLAVKRSLGITRGKDDAIDARKPALYGYRLRAELSPYQKPEKQIHLLQSVLKLRDRLFKQRAGYKTSLKEQKCVLQDQEYQLLLLTQKQIINQLSQHIKKLLNICAMVAIQHDGQIKDYYQQKLKQGKAKMSVINAVRNKIIARIFAVVNRKTPFVDTFKFAA